MLPSSAVLFARQECYGDKRKVSIQLEVLVGAETITGSSFFNDFSRAHRNNHMQRAHPMLEQPL